MNRENESATRAPKRLTAARLAGEDELEETFSDLTDTRDIWDGGGEQPPSKGRHVALLQESLIEMGYELPTYGVDGVYGAETTAAVLQFQIDAGHPLPAGHEWEHVLGMGGPNTLAHFDMFTPGGTVGYATGRSTGVIADAVEFAESPDNLFAGFDDSVSPPSLVVGTSTRRRVRVEIEPADAEVEFAADDSSVATVGVTHEGIVVGGERAGTTVIRATSLGNALAELHVSVRDARNESVNFFFVSSTNNGTTRDHEKATLLTLRLNRVLRRQANVCFSVGQVEDVVLQGAVGPQVDADDLLELAGRALPGALNVFLVRALAPGLEPVQLDASPFVVLPDDDCPDGMDLMHGVTHYLARSLADGRSGITAPCGTDTDRRRVSREVADMVNSSSRG
jgi:peptidoglycan hydrolase-like protein with peptidoglycan-binding domain